MENTILKMEGIVKKFYSITALKGVDFELYRGEIHAMVGENGAGKSTLMKILSGSYSCTSYDGKIFINGNPVRFISPGDAEKSGIQMIYQEISLTLDLTVAENIFMGNLPRKAFKPFVDWKKMYETTTEALKRVGLDVKPDETVRNLSTSQMQLLCIAKALYRNPKLLVLDEPTSALTASETTNLLSIIRGLRDEGISCIYISHKLNEVFEIADRITVLRDGKTISTYEKKDFNEDRVVHDMVGRDIDEMYPKVKAEFGKELLRVENMTVKSTISGKNVVEDVSFSVRAGEILGIGGLVGAGRSELINAVFGAIPRISGKVFVDGEELSDGTISESIARKIGLVTEDRRATGFVPTMNIRENISLASFEKIFGKMFIKNTVEKASTKKYFDKLRVKAPGIETGIVTLSGGNQQKVVLAKWLMRDVKILFLDEPTRGIDVGAKVEIYNIMNDLAAQGVALVMISSETNELLAMCDRFVVLSAGKVKRQFTSDEITQESYMRAATGL